MGPIAAKNFSFVATGGETPPLFVFVGGLHLPPIVADH